MGRERDTSVNLLLLLLFSFIIVGITACGPGGGKRPNVPVRKFYGDRIPDVPEESSMASGSFDGALLKDDKNLKTLISTEIIFADASYEADSRKAIEVSSIVLQ